jgi:hypothetical protein
MRLVISKNKNLCRFYGEVADRKPQSSPAADDEDAINITRAKLRLRKYGVHVAWSTQDT